MNSDRHVRHNQWIQLSVSGVDSLEICVKQVNWSVSYETADPYCFLRYKRM